jgi:hypothetical protein
MFRSTLTFRVLWEGSLHVTKNLEVALRYLRLPKKHRILWIDAFCIDQDNLNERGAQARRMGLIYQNTRQVIVWLGLGIESSLLAVQTLRTIGKGFKADYNTYTGHSVKNSMTESLEADDVAIASMEAEWLAIRDFLYSAWFTRLWVHQEINLSKRAVMLVKHLELEWDIFVSAVRWLKINPASSAPELQIFNQRYMERFVYNIILDVRQEGLSGATYVIHGTRFGHCADPRDRVYGVLDLINKNLDASRHVFVVPNYQKTVEQVYENFITCVIQKYSSLEILQMCGPRDSWTNIPSWVPDISDTEIPFKLLGTGCTGTRSYDCRSISISNSRLEISSILLDAISCTTPVVPFSAKDPELVAICELWEPKSLLTESYVLGASLVDAYIETLVCGYTSNDDHLLFGWAPQHRGL